MHKKNYRPIEFNNIDTSAVSSVEKAASDVQELNTEIAANSLDLNERLVSMRDDMTAASSLCQGSICEQLPSAPEPVEAQVNIQQHC